MSDKFSGFDDHRNAGVFTNTGSEGWTSETFRKHAVRMLEESRNADVTPHVLVPPDYYNCVCELFGGEILADETVEDM